jgi:hypothetical protein
MNIAVVEGRLFVDAQRRELVPISSIATEKKTLPEGVKELAVLFFLAGHTTRVTADDGGRSAPRLDGLYAMVCLLCRVTKIWFNIPKNINIKKNLINFFLLFSFFRE